MQGDEDNNDGVSGDMGGPFFVASDHRQLRRVSAIDEDSRRHPAPTISVTREIEQTLSRPPAIRDSSEEPDPNETEVPAPASETMC